MIRPGEMSASRLLEIGFRHWDGQGLLLVPAALVDSLEPGTELTSIYGGKAVVGQDEFGRDTRYGLLVWGVFAAGQRR